MTAPLTPEQLREQVRHIQHHRYLVDLHGVNLGCAEPWCPLNGKPKQRRTFGRQVAVALGRDSAALALAALSVVFGVHLALDGKGYGVLFIMAGSLWQGFAAGRLKR